MEYRYQTSESMAHLYPMVKIKGHLHINKEGKSTRTINLGNYKRADWGNATAPTIIDKNTYPFPYKASMTWLSPTEAKAFKAETPLDSDQIEKNWQQKDSDGYPLFEFIVAGMAPNGGLAVWLRGQRKSVLIATAKGQELDDTAVADMLGGKSIKEISQTALCQNPEILQHLLDNGLPPRDLFDHWMEQMEYRYMPLEEYWDGETWREYDEDDLFYDDIMLNELHVQRYDGTHHQLPDDISLLKYHKAGMPKQLALRWDEGDSHLSAYWWFDDQLLYPVLHHFFYSLAPGARTDLLLRLDSRHQRFEMALKGGEMLTQPIDIPQTTYQLIIFKDGHELYHSKNFNKEDGAWDW